MCLWAEKHGIARVLPVEKPVENVHNFFVNNITAAFYVKY